jgi:Spy/CpxP family protein refolding chaperone
MFGFFFAALCLGGLAAIAFGRRGCGGYGGRWHSHHFHSRRGFGGWALHRALDRLDTTPGQEKVIVAALDELRAAAQEARNKVSSSRVDVASALRAEHFEGERVDAVIARHAEDVAQLGSAARAALGKIHEALDPEQRKRLATWLESSPGLHWA